MTPDKPVVAAITVARTSLLTVGVTVVLCLGLYFYGHMLVQAEIADAMADTDTLAKKQAELMAAHIDRIANMIDAIHGLARLADNAARAGTLTVAAEAAQQLTAWKDGLHDGIVQVAVIAPSGYMTWSNLGGPAVPVYLGDRDHFLAIARDKKSSYVSTPVVGRVSGRTTIQLSAGSVGPEGMMQSVSVVSVDPSLFATLARELGVDGTDTVTILRNDNALLASTADDAAAIARQMPLPPFASGQIAGAWRDQAPIAGITRSYAWHVATPNMKVVIGLNTRKQFADAQPTIARIHRLTWTTIGLAAFGGLALMFYLQLRSSAAAALAKTNAIQESAIWFKTMADGLPYMVRLLDRNGIAIYVNPSIKNILGRNPADVLGVGSQSFIHPDDRDVFRTTLFSLLKTTEARGIRIKAVHADGSIVMLHSIMSRIASADNDLAGPRFIVTSRDVTAEDKWEADILAAKRELEDVMAATPGVFFRTERGAEGIPDNTQIVFVSNGIQHLLGFTPQEMMEPGSIGRQIDPLSLPSMREYFKRLDKDGAASVNYRIRHKNGNWIWLTAVSRLAIERDKKTSFGYAYDITKEHDRDIHLAQVEKLVMLGDMTTGMAHELNQPLAGISMIAENALALVDDSTAPGRSLERKLQRIVSQVARAATIIDHMRVFGRKVGDSITEFSADLAVRGALSILNGKIALLDIELQCDMAPDLPPLSGSIVLCEQLLVNVIGNAIDQIEGHIPPLPLDRRRIQLTTALEQGMVTIEVRDTAGGIDTANIERVFEPFFTTKAVGKGTGLGLSISYGIVQDMGGLISARNQEDGACFRIELPAVVTEVSPAQSYPNAPTMAGAAVQP
jgi:PAS domain S-box-containing protein